MTCTNFRQIAAGPASTVHVHFVFAGLSALDKRAEWLSLSLTTWYNYMAVHRAPIHPHRLRSRIDITSKREAIWSRNNIQNLR